MTIDILYESDSFIVVNKPYDMFINSDDETIKNTVACHIGRHDSHRSTSTAPLHFVQRLDYSTSGVLCVAKNKAAAADAGKLFERRHSSKYYLAVLRRTVPFELADVRFDVGTDTSSPSNSHKMAAVTGHISKLYTSCCGQPRAAHTRIALMETGFYDDDPVSLVMLKPITGRRHQLRVHCHSIGHTVVGDYTYSDRTDTTPHRMLLHAARLVLPLKAEPLDIRAPEPFYSDAQFSRSYRCDVRLRGFDDACDALDAADTGGFQYKSYRNSE